MSLLYGTVALGAYLWGVDRHGFCTVVKEKKKGGGSSGLCNVMLCVLYALIAYAGCCNLISPD